MLRKRRRFTQFAVRARYETPVTIDPPDPATGVTAPLPSRLLEVLSPRERAALCLWANEGYAAKDIAEVLSCSASTARVYLFNARRKIKALLENEHGLLQHG